MTTPRPKHYRDASTGQYTTAADAAARPAETVSEAIDRLTVGRGKADDADLLRAELAHMTEARDNARAEVERLAALVAEVRETAEHYYGQAYADGSAAVLRILGLNALDGAES